MKVLIFMVLLAAVIYISSASNAEEQWKEYKVTYKRTYKADEDKKRFKIFKDTLEQIKEHNDQFKKGKVDIEATLNDFSDLTNEEKLKLINTEDTKELPSTKEVKKEVKTEVKKDVKKN